MKARLLALACGVAVLVGSVGGADAARLYRWKDKQGYTQYGDQPPPPEQLAGSGRAPGLPLTLQLAGDELRLERLLRVLPGRRYVGVAQWRTGAWAQR